MGRKRGNRSADQRRMRKRRNERAFLFDQELTACLGEFGREAWEDAIVFSGGKVADAARLCGLEVPRNARALWGTTQEGARSTYQGWLNRKRKKARNRGKKKK